MWYFDVTRHLCVSYIGRGVPWSECRIQVDDSDVLKHVVPERKGRKLLAFDSGASERQWLGDLRAAVAFGISWHQRNLSNFC